MPQLTVDQALNTAVRHHQANELAKAEAIYRKILEQHPNHAPSLHLLGVLAAQIGRHDDAIAANRRAIEIVPHYAAAYSAVGVSLIAKGDLDGAIESFRRAISLQPDFPDAHCNLGAALSAKGRLDEAIACFRRAVEIRPDYVDAYRNLGVTLSDNGRLDEAASALKKALEVQPTDSNTLSCLGVVLSESGLSDEAIAAFRSAVDLSPGNPRIQSNLVYAMLFHPDVDAETNLQECRKWARRHEQPLVSKRPATYRNVADPSRRLRIGYVSGDFRLHPVGRFILPLLAHHDHQQFEIFCYSNLHLPHPFTARIQSHANVWRDIQPLSDEQAAALIQQDQIDILVDLSMHLANNRLPLFARKPAPVQVTYLAYAGTTGLDSIDYRITDPYLDPPGQAEFYSEKSVRLPASYWCYEAPADDLELTPPPCLSAGHVTFGCLNNFCKVNLSTLATWAKLLSQIPESRLLLHASAGQHRDRALRVFAEHPIDPARVSFIQRLPLPLYMRKYNNIDIALDPIPYVGGTTTCDALWMGVPTITLRGSSALARGGASILSNVGLPELIAGDREEYIRLARELALDHQRLIDIRSTLRERMRTSPLMNAAKFARDMESAYRRMWAGWCGLRSSNPQG